MVTPASLPGSTQQPLAGKLKSCFRRLETFLFRGGDDHAVSDEAGSGVVVEARDAQDNHRSSSPWRIAECTGPSTNTAHAPRVRAWRGLCSASAQITGTMRCLPGRTGRSRTALSETPHHSAWLHGRASMRQQVAGASAGGPLCPVAPTSLLPRRPYSTSPVNGAGPS